MSKPVLLFLEDEEKVRRPIVQAAEDIGYEVVSAEDVETALDLCRNRPDIAVAIVDLRIRPDEDFTAGWDFLKKANLPDATQVIVFTGHEDRSKLDALRKNPPKDVNTGFLVLHKSGGERRLFEVLDQQLARHNDRQTGGIKHASKEDLQRKADLPMIAASGLPVLITGPTGSGKEHVAQEIAELALPKSQHARIHTVNCAALTENLAIATLFGYEEGAYTGAKRGGDDGILKRITGTMNQTARAGGRVDPKALPGILILDELAELPIYVQAQLLRMMQGQPINALGDSGIGYTPVIRVIGCTNDEEKLFNPDKFRQDLLGRLYGWHITVGSPRERKDTFIDAAVAFAKGFSITLQFGKPPIKISDVAADVPGEVAAKLASHEFPFGFRELNGWVGRACALALYREKNDTQLTASDLRDAWDRRMKLDESSKKISGKGEEISLPRPEKIAEVRGLFEEVMYGKDPANRSWNEKDLRDIAKRFKTEDVKAYSKLVALKKKFAETASYQRLLYLAINGADPGPTEMRRFVARLRKYLGDPKQSSLE